MEFVEFLFTCTPKDAPKEKKNLKQRRSGIWRGFRGSHTAALAVAWTHPTSTFIVALIDEWTSEYLFI